MKMRLSVKVAAGSAAALVMGLLFGWVAFPKILRSQISKQMTLIKGTDIREMWSKVPFPLDFKIYLFNCTNVPDVMKGRKPIVEEIGPYFYDEWKEKVNMVDVEEEDAVYYNRRDTFIFNKEKSGPGLTGDEMIVMPHILILTTAVVVALEKPAMLNLVGKAIHGIYDEPDTVFLTAKAKDILFDGIVINCDRTDFAPKAVCTAMKKEAKDLEQFGKNQFKFSLFGQKNGSIEVPKFKVLRGSKNIMDLGRVVEFNGQTAQAMWGGPECNDFNGTDSTIFPPFLTEKDELVSFTPDICRSLGARYERKSMYSGIPGNRYVLDLGDLANEPKWHCFCDTPETCPGKGLMDIRKCVTAPLIVSLPHFLGTDISIQESVRGLRPDVEEHGIYVDFEPISGTPLQARKRLQFNIRLQKIEKLDLFKDLPDTLIPMFWVEEGVALNATFIKLLDSQLFRTVRIVGVLKWSMVCGGSIGLFASALLHYRTRIMKFAVTPASAEARNEPNRTVIHPTRPQLPKSHENGNGVERF